MIKAIETPYNGYLFRSQLEARWALFFDQICIPYIYELDGYKLANGSIWYRPDFWLPKHRIYVEVKPYSPSKMELDKAYHLTKERRARTTIVCGDPLGLLEVHDYSYYPLTKETWGLISPLIVDSPELFSLLEHISEDAIIFYQKGDLLHYYIGLDYDSLRHATSKNDVAELLTYFDIGYRDKDRDVVWDAIGHIIDWHPDVTALIPNEARRARMHQFWRPKQ